MGDLPSCLGSAITNPALVFLLSASLCGWGGSGASTEQGGLNIRHPALVLASVESSLSRGGNENNLMRSFVMEALGELYIVVDEF